MTEPDHRAVRDLLGAATAGEPPLGLRAEALAAAGRRRLFRRRAGLAVAALLTVGVVGAGATSLSGIAAPPPELPAAPGPTSCTPVDMAPQPVGVSRPLPASEAIDDAVRSAVAVKPSAQPNDPGGVSRPSRKLHFNPEAGGDLGVEVTAAGDPGTEMNWAADAARAVCRTVQPRRDLADGAVALPTSSTGRVHLHAVGGGLRVVIEATAAEGPSAPLTVDQLSAAAEAILALG